MSGNEPKQDKKTDLHLEEWEIKTLLQDIENSGFGLDEVNLDILSKGQNKDYYGTSRNPKYKNRRVAISSKLQEFKRKTAPTYLKFVRGFGVEPSKFTIANAKTVTMGSKSKEADEEMEYIEEKIQNINLDDKSFGFGSAGRETPLTPPRPAATEKLKAPIGGFGSFTKSPEPVTPPRSVTYPTAASSSLSYFTSMEEVEPKVFGTYDCPWKIRLVPGFSGRYMNNIWCYEEAKQVKENSSELNKGKKKLAYSGYLFKVKVDAPDIGLFSCFVADDHYIERLVDNGIIKHQDMTCAFAVIRGPYVEAYDRVGLGGIIDHQWISAESEETVKKVHSNIKAASEEDDSPGPSWVYTILQIPPGYALDNRVFSGHDNFVAPYESMPNKTRVAALGNEDVLAFHVQWRIALKGTETLMDDTARLSLAERIKQRRDQHK